MPRAAAPCTPGSLESPVSLSSFSFQNVPSKAGTPGTTQDSTAPAGGAAPAGSPPGGSMFTMLLPFLIFVPILFMMFRRQKKEAESRKGLKKGDRVVSTSGLIGELIDLDDRVAKVKLAPGTTVQMLANSVSPFVEVASKAATPELKDAKAVSDKK
jgi:preprotein translocase subunit YajC